MTDWKEAARKHEASADGYARLYYDAVEANKELAEALEELLSHPSDEYEDAIDTDDGYTLTPLGIAERKATKVVRKHKENNDG